MVTRRTESDVAPGAVGVARRYLASWASERGTDTDSADIGGHRLLAAPRDLSGLSLLEQINIVDERLDTLNTSLRVIADPGFAQPLVRISEASWR